MAQPHPPPKLPLHIATDYLILPLSIPPHTPSYPSPTTHYIYLRPHVPKIPDRDTPRSIFVLNIPIDSTTSSIRALFATQLGGSRVERVDFDGSTTTTSTAESAAGGKKRKRGAGTKRKRRMSGAAEEEVEPARLPRTWDRELCKSGSGAVVVFVDVASAELALRTVRKIRREGRQVGWKPIEVPKLGFERYLTHHHLSYPSSSQLLTAINAHLTAFSAHETARANLLKRQRSQPDEDGFITVTRGGRTGPARMEEAQEAAKKLKERQEKMAGGSFYRFQVRDRNKKMLEGIRKGFEEDKKRLEEMRERKRLKPM